MVDFKAFIKGKAVKMIKDPKTGQEKYGRGNFFVDRFPEGDEKYLTWYCRPNMNPEMIKEKSKNRS